MNGILYAGEQYSRIIKRYDLSTETELDPIDASSIISELYCVYAGTDNKSLLINGWTYSNEEIGCAKLYNTVDGTYITLPTDATGGDFSSDCKYVYYVEDEYYFHKYEIATGTDTKVDLGVTYNNAIAISEDDKTAYVLSYYGDCMKIIDLDTMTVTGTVDIEGPFIAGGFSISKATIKQIAESGPSYPEVWEPYYETLALKIQAQAEVEAAKMLKEANLVEEPVVEEPVIEEEPFELVAKSERVIAPNGKDSVKITWTDKNDKELDLDGYEIFRSNALDGEYVCMFDTENEWYYNTLVKKGEKYYYKVRGYKMVDGEKEYTQFSSLAYRTVK